MSLTEISISDAKVGDRISITDGGPVHAGVFLVRETMPIDGGCVAVELQPVDGGAPIEATLPGDTPVGQVPHAPS